MVVVLEWLQFFVFIILVNTEWLWRHEHIQQMSLETSIELQEVQGRGGQQGMIPAPTTASWRAVSVCCTVQGLENAPSLQDDPLQQEFTSMGRPTSAVTHSKTWNKCTIPERLICYVRGTHQRVWLWYIVTSPGIQKTKSHSTTQNNNVEHRSEWLRKCLAS